MVNVAGIGTDHGILDGDYEEWMKMIQINLLAPTLTSKLAMEVSRIYTYIYMTCYFCMLTGDD